MKKEKKRAIFFDRDGVLNKKPAPHDYVKKNEEFKWNNGAKELVKIIHDYDFIAIVISNQQGVALGKMSQKFVEDLHKRMNKDLKSLKTRIDAFYICFHSSKDNCVCRKPKPGLFLLAKKDFGIDLEKSYMIGDSQSDIEAAKRAGCKNNILIKSDLIDIEYIVNQII